MLGSTFPRNLTKLKTGSSRISTGWPWYNHTVRLGSWSKYNFSTHAGSHDDIKTSTSHFSPIPLQELALGYNPQIKGRPYLPGSTSGGFPEFLPGPQEGSSFPKAYEVKNSQQYDVKGWSLVCRQLIDEELAIHGAILIRNLPLSSMGDFQNFLQNLNFKFFEHGVTGYRTPLGGHVYTASDDPPEVTIEPHNECSYSPLFPKKIVMFCLREPNPSCGGETVLLKSQDLTASLDPKVIQKFEAKKIRYQAFLPNKDTGAGLQKSWQDRFWMDDPKEVQTILELNGWSYSWDKGKNLRYWYLNSPVIQHPITGEKIWFNQITSYNASYFRALPLYENTGDSMKDDQFPFHCYYGDGSDIEPEVLQHIREVMWSYAVGFWWRTFDVAVLDNQQVLHGRMGWTGDRKLVTSLIAE